MEVDILYLQAKNYLDLQSGELIEPANFLIQGSDIAAINPKKIPKAAIIIKRPGLTLLPGLMDMHVHLTADFSGNFYLQYIQEDGAMATVRGVKNANVLLMAGFTTVRNLGQLSHSECFIDVALAKASDSKWIPAPHIIPAGHALSITGGHMDPSMIIGAAHDVLPVSYRVGVADGVDEVVKAVRYQIKYGARVIKAAATSGVISKGENVGNAQFSYQELKAIVEEASRHDIPVAVHAHGTEGIKNSIKAGVSSIEHGSLLDDECIQLMKSYGTFLVPTACALENIKQKDLDSQSSKKANYLKPLAKQSLIKAIKAGIKIAFGTDSPIIPHGENAKEFTTLVQRGMSPIEAIRTATSNAAMLLKLDKIGELKAGFHADIIGVEGNPLTHIEILEKVKLVIKCGKVMKGQENED